MTTEVANPILPPSVSADAKRNAFYTKCPEQQSTKPYAMCQYIAANQGDASLKTLYADCMAAIHRGRCVAVDMKAEEQLKGQAIYFIERVKGAAVVAAQTAWTSPLTLKANRARREYAAPVAAPAPAPKKPVFEFDGNIYAAALNAAVKKESSATNDPPPQPKVTPVAIAPTPAIKPAAAPTIQVNLTRRAGESPLDFARRLRASQGAQA